MAVLFDETVTLAHRVFQQPEGRVTGLPQPLGMAYAHYADTFSASADDSNAGSIKPQGVDAYVYTLHNASIRWSVTGSVTTQAEAAAVQNFLETVTAEYYAQPLLTDIGDQAYFGNGISFDFWAFERQNAWTDFLTVSNVSYPKSGRAILIPSRNVDHPGSWPTTLPSTWSAATSPKLNLWCGEISSLVAGSDPGVNVTLSYLFWGARDRLSANAYASLPVRGT